MFGTVFVLWSLSTLVVALETEPQCSRYVYDHKIITALVTMEVEQKELKKVMDKHSQLQLKQQITLQQLEQTLRQQEEALRQKEETMQKQEETLQQQEEALRKQEEAMRKQEEAMRKQEEAMRKQEQVIDQYRKSYEDTARTLEEHIKGITTSSGSMYVRWGRTTCPDNGTETVYSGYAGGSHYSHSGAAANFLCLPSDPLWGKYDNSVNGHAYIYGTEYQVFGSYGKNLFNKEVGDHDVPCAVCRSVRASGVMVPARNLCYPGWTMEYSGYLMTGYISHTAASEYVCLDDDPEFVPDSGTSFDGKLLYTVDARCGSLKCPPYVDGRELTCAVCTQ